MAIDRRRLLTGLVTSPLAVLPVFPVAQKMQPDIIRVWFLGERGVRVVIEKAGLTVEARF
jgi:hypothetical protein